MSDEENFLNRWSRRKQDVANQEAKPEEPAGEQGKAEQPEPGAPAESLDLSKLPSLDDITAETDISAFLKPGIPGDLARAALRRAWTSDPAIRDFVGLQENDWVFNKPGPEQGFGPLGPETDVGKLVAEVFGAGPKEEPPAAQNKAPADISEPVGDAPPPDQPSRPAPPRPAPKNDAAHHNAAETPAPRRTHGRALPRPIPES
jgi:hypothetical protein